MQAHDRLRLAHGEVDEERRLREGSADDGGEWTPERLRKLLNPGREQDPIRTVRGAGYALDDRFAKADS